MGQNVDSPMMSQTVQFWSLADAAPRMVAAFPRKVAGTLLVVAFAISSACASTEAIPQPFPMADSPAVRPPAGIASGPASGYAIAGTALSLRGTPYRNGGSDPSGFDCSGFIWYVFARHGIDVPRTVGDQYRAGHSILPDALQAGDLVFFNTVVPGASHVGMVIGGDEFVHAPSSVGEVRVERFSAPYWRSRFVGARRIL
jgi:cell wall-associated NlpC family hydrolase